MATYIALIDFTAEGIENIHYTTRRSRDFAEEAKDLIEIRQVYWTMGAHDGVLIFEAADDETAIAALLKLGQHGKARTKTLRAFDRDEMDAILAKM